MLLSAGSNAHGQLSNRTLDDSHVFLPCCFSGCAPGTLPTGRKLLHLAFGANHTLALFKSTRDSDQELWGCGDGKSGQLGPSYDDESTSIFRPLDLALERHGLAEYVPRLVAASWETSYVVLSRPDMPDVLLAMGANDFGDLGIGAKGKMPAKDIHVIRFDYLGVSGPLVVDSLAAGQHHVVASLKGGQAVGWGTSRHGQLGNVETPFLSSPVLIPQGRADDAIVHAALGHQHTVFLHASETVSGLGSNRKRQLEGIEAAANIQSVACTWNGTYLATGAGDVLSAGNNVNGQLGRADGPLARVEFPFTPATHRLLQLACGSEHVLASFSVLDTCTTEVWGWGWNEHGNLGVGTTEDVRIPIKIWSTTPSIKGDIGIWAGSGTSWIAVQQ
ncbi:regulator of chromosome condensation 1/beta-lactamase-inhibitor protein II [Mycena polygramma]|nr:regulator of chromosome condensation 1/beta-lactamase-inhibitor protein II [Mycena polygramma]